MADKKFNPEDHMMDLKGKKYLQVMWRLVWFREEHPDWAIKTELKSNEENTAVFKAEILNAEGSVLSTGYGSENIKDFRDYLEKAETKSVGRALAMLGYGTQFAPELDEGERIVDSPVPKKESMSADNQKVTPTMISALLKELERTGNDPDKLMEYYKLANLEDMSCSAWKKCMESLKKKESK